MEVEKACGHGDSEYEGVISQIRAQVSVIANLEKVEVLAQGSLRRLSIMPCGWR